MIQYRRRHGGRQSMRHAMPTSILDEHQRRDPLAAQAFLPVSPTFQSATFPSGLWLLIRTALQPQRGASRGGGARAPMGIALIIGISLVQLTVTCRATLNDGAPTVVLPHADLMVYCTSHGEVAPVIRKEDWQKRRALILQNMQSVMGSVPKEDRRCSLELKVEAEVDEGSFVRQSITYTSEPGSRVPAWLLIPKRASNSKKRLAAVLALHPTDMEYGNRVVAEQLRGQYPPYGNELAKRGFVVIAPAYPLMANYQPDLKSLHYTSGTMKAVWDNMRALDLLANLPFVKKGKFAAIGHSLGGHNAIFTAVFDPRIKVIISSCGFDSFRDYKDGDITGWTSERYMPKLADYKSRVTEIPFDFDELIGALSPRAVFISAPLHDSNFKAQSVDAIAQAAKPVYRLYGVPANLRLAHPDCGHEFPDEIREDAYRFLDSAMR
jgi:dienelactone hydrolase